MKAAGINTGEVPDLVKAELAGYLGEALVIAGVTSELRTGPDGEDYIRTLARGGDLVGVRTRVRECRPALLRLLEATDE